jgi:allophanate hydrolase
MALTIQAILQAHRNGTAPADTIRDVYARIRAYGDPALFITLRPEEEAIAAAERLAGAGAQDQPLYGVPFVVKDNIDVAGLPTTCACPAFEYRPTRSAEVVAKLEAAGAVVIGKTNLDQFATGLVGVRSPYGVPRNALRPDLIPGGSSSGSAVAVAAGLVPFALGTDTAGSGRVPAALNGIVGLKPSLGALSTSGVVPACRTLDCVSVFALTVEDAYLAFDVAAGFDPSDPFSRRLPRRAMGAPPPTLRIGVPRPDQLKFFGDGAAEAAYAADVARFAQGGGSIVEIDFEPFASVARFLYEGPWVAERYAATKPLIEERPEALHPVTRQIIESGKNISAVAAFEAFYRLAGLRRASEGVWATIDLLALPTIPATYTIAEVEADPIRLNSNLGTYTNFVNLLDLAAIAIPSGMRRDGLPSSLTLIAPAGSDAYLAGIGAALQTGSDHALGMASLPLRAKPGQIELAVVGAHLSGMPLNRELVGLGASFVRKVETTKDYRLYALPGSNPPKPGLLKVAAESGNAIAAEIWALDAEGFGSFVSRIPPPLGIGTLTFTDGTTAKGFLAEAEALRQAQDISHLGGWRAFMAGRA